MVNIEVKNTSRVLRVDDDIAEKIINLDLRYYSNKSGGYIAIVTENRKVLRLTGYILGGYGNTIKYKDGDIFNCTKDNVIIGRSRGQIQVRDDIECTIMFRGKLIKFDREDYERLRGYSLSVTRGHLVICARAEIPRDIRPSGQLSLKKYLFNTENHMTFKNGDNTDYRRNNIEINKNRKHREPRKSNKISMVKGKYKGVRVYRDMYMVKENSEAPGVYVKCTYVEAAMVYNYLNRNKERNINYFNYTGYTAEEEDRIAENIIKHHTEVLDPDKRKNSSSKYYGVSWDTDTSKWMCRTTLLGKKYYLGIYMEEKEAAKAYNKKAIEVLGDKARLNNI